MNVSLYQAVCKLSLLLAFSASAGSFFFVWFFRSYSDTPLRYVGYACYAPAIVLGCWSWLRVRSFAKSWPVVGCALLALIAILWADRSETKRSILVFYNMAAIFPISALIVEMNYREACARCFLIVSAAALALLFHLHYKDDPRLIQASLGYLKEVMGTASLANPNAVGNQMALAMLLSIGFYIGEIKKKRQAISLTELNHLFYIPIIFFLGIGTVLTRSREAILAMVLPALVIFLCSKRQFKRKIILILMVISVLVIVPFTRFSGEMSAVWERFTNIENLLTLNERTTIWNYVGSALTSEPKYLLIGVGTGATERVLGAQEGHDFIPIMWGEDGIPRRSPHNAFLDWILSYGLLGLILGTTVSLVAIRRAWLLDRRDKTVYRRALVLFFFIISMAMVTYRYAFWPAFGSYLLAVLTDGSPETDVSRIRASTSYIR